VVLCARGVVQPLPRAHALLNQRALADGSVRWNFHSCGSYECLNQRTAGDWQELLQHDSGGRPLARALPGVPHHPRSGGDEGRGPQVLLLSAATPLTPPARLSLGPRASTPLGLSA